jgi:hypothetical protein
LSSNPPKNNAIISFVIAITAAVMIFIPETVGLDGFEGGFAVSFVSLVIAITAAIVGFMFFGWAAKVSRIQRGEGILAHWVYTPEFWASYTEKEYQEEKSEKKGLFLIVTAFALFFGILFWVLDEEAGFYVFLVMLGLIGLCLFAWQFSAWSTYRSNSRRGVKEVFITDEAVFMNNKLVTWKTAFTHIDEVEFEHKRRVPVLVFRYTQWSGRAGPQSYTTRVPVPSGEEPTASYIVEQLNPRN